jgi:tRNA (guanine-N7-)-methyltransferase
MHATFARLMGKKNKLAKFAEVEQFSNCYQYDKDQKGQWQSAFKKPGDLILELACGKGEYTVGMARMHPENNYMGLDVKGNRIWKGAKTALEDGLSNVAFLRCQINGIEEYFDKGEVREIWITFPDPQPREGKAKHRLTHPRFLEKYKQIGIDGICINLKTDSSSLYAYTKEVIDENNLELLADSADVYAWEGRPEELNIQTYYENIWLTEGKKIKFLKFRL